jgi:beta-aspartyl-peptidase (threonine type)
MGLIVLDAQRAAQAADQPRAPRVEYALAVHGGAGIEPDRMTAEQRGDYEKSLAAALERGRAILAEGGTALDAVEQVVRLLEDDPLFNAGRGAVFNSAGAHELDASMMDGRTKACGAVAAVRTVKNPISLARLVMTETRHVLLIGDGAEQFADEMRHRKQIERVENSWFSTPGRRADWERALERERQQKAQQSGKGTVGCVALDRHGNLAAAASTGGLTNKRFGRVGDSPIIGAGTYADNSTCAVSCTGTGEEFIRHAIAFRVSALMSFKDVSLADAVREALAVLPREAGGLIAVGADGSISMQMNTAGMARAAADSTGRFEVRLGR